MFGTSKLDNPVLFQIRCFAVSDWSSNYLVHLRHKGLIKISPNKKITTLNNNNRKANQWLFVFVFTAE